MNPKKAKFSIGDIVKHKHFDFRGVIYDVDFEFNNSEEWYQSIPKNVRPKKDQPFYHLLAENDEITYEAYVSEQNLVIDDSETMREMIKSQFEQSGMEFSFAENGKNALDILEKNNNFDLIICDVYMDEMSGIEFVKAQDQDEKLKNIPTVLMTSRFNPSFLKEINGVKVVKSWLVKPFKPEQLSLLIKNILKLE